MALESAIMMAQQTITVLNVDDNEGSRYILTHRLEQAGFRVLEAGSGEEALQQLVFHPDIVSNVVCQR